MLIFSIGKMKMSQSKQRRRPLVEMLERVTGRKAISFASLKATRLIGVQMIPIPYSLGEIVASEDCSLVKRYPNINYNTKKLGWGIFPKYAHVIRSVLKFDLGLLEEVRFRSARLFLYGRVQYKPATVEAWYSDYDDWNETTVTWDNQPRMVKMIGSTTEIPSEISWFSLDLTVDEIKAKIEGNKLLTLILKGDEEATENSYCYADDKEAGNGAKIQVYPRRYLFL